ncbi:MAG TPA: AtpZ/AtpI family protein [Thermoanaerobaculia bacterium]|nr:AtpZ/AtpI family protein [Thermoanaerobaculia bacterium]
MDTEKPEPDTESDREKSRANAQMLEASSLGFMFPLAIGIGFGIGYWMDRLFGTKPWLTLVFTGFGIAAAFVNLFRLALRK